MPTYVGCPACGKTIEVGQPRCGHCGTDVAAAAARPPGPAISCDKCKQANMFAPRVPRMSPGLRIIGFTLWVPALVLLIASAGCGVLMGGVGSRAASESNQRMRNEIANDLLDIAQIPRGEIESFQRTGTFDRDLLERLPPEDRRKAASALSTYDAMTTGSAIGSAAATGFVGMGVLAVYVICLPLFIVGLLLTLKKNVWKCPTCGYVFDRA